MDHEWPVHEGSLAAAGWPAKGRSARPRWWPVADETHENYPCRNRVGAPLHSRIRDATRQPCFPARPSARIDTRRLNSGSNVGMRCHFRDAHSSEAGHGGETSMRREEMLALIRLFSPTELLPG